MRTGGTSILREATTVVGTWNFSVVNSDSFDGILSTPVVVSLCCTHFFDSCDDVQGELVATSRHGFTVSNVLLDFQSWMHSDPHPLVAWLCQWSMYQFTINYGKIYYKWVGTSIYRRIKKHVFKQWNGSVLLFPPDPPLDSITFQLFHGTVQLFQFQFQQCQAVTFTGNQAQSQH